MPESHVRAGDADRTAVATALGRHMADGRLTVAEYDERVARAYAARTYGDLAALTADLPTIDRSRAVDPVRREHPVAREHSGARGCGSTGWGADRRASYGAWRSWLGTALIVVTIWAITSIMASSFIYFWPIWVIGPWGAMLLAHTLGGGRRERGSRQRT